MTITIVVNICYIMMITTTNYDEKNKMEVEIRQGDEEALDLILKKLENK